ncbi:hypothetical protein BXZ70DRAFT_740287 [Cristinia sonorae]|uniref:Uncharacterized protein n=1 Tax=Cristinia sonorae TaxID=1940300 RepID=A0A8K0XSJ3_9AGAR|nr:hypothetical protein BXZ70DRAFT_740287 [Cristinia sonorae]
MFELLSFILSFIGLATIIPQIHALLAAHLPESRFKQLDATLRETAELLNSAIQDGFMDDPEFVRDTKARLYCLRNVTEHLRVRVLSAPGFFRQCIALMKGLSKRIGEAENGADLVRTRVAVSTVPLPKLYPSITSIQASSP